jgi:DnaK suppressor protein
MKLDLQKQKRRLEEKKAELERSIAALTEAHPTPVSSTEANEGPRDHQDVATDFLEIQQEQSILVNQQSLLTLVNNALQRLEDGTYGLCLQCGKPIPPARLEVLPWAERDVQCEEQVERVYQKREEVYGPPQTFY